MRCNQATPLTKPWGTAIITAAGSSQRMGGERKELLCIAGKPLILHTLERFIATGLFDQIVVTTSQESYQEIEALMAPFAKVSVILGGDTRQKSVYKGLLHIEQQCLDGAKPQSDNANASSHVLIHDGARPWVSTELIQSVLDATIAHGAAAPMITPQDTIKLVDTKGWIINHPTRERTGAIQTPQGFRFTEILQAHREAALAGLTVTDDTELYAKYVAPVFTVEGERTNKKVTFPEDLNAVGSLQDLGKIAGASEHA